MNISGFEKCSDANGDGFRVVLYVSGCGHRCSGCHNPETWNKNIGHPFTEETKQYLFDCLDKPYIDGITLTGGDPLFGDSLQEILDLVSEINNRYNTPQYIVCNKNKNHNILNKNTNEIHVSFPLKTIWIYSGYTFEEIFGEYAIYNDCHNKKRQEIISKCGVFVDGRYEEDKRDITLKWRGSSNQRVIDVQKSLIEYRAVLYCD